MSQEGLLGGQEQPRATNSVPRASQERPKSVPRAAKSVPRAAKSAPRERSWRPELPKTRQEAPKTLQVGLQRRPREVQELQNSSPSAIRQQTAPPFKNHGFPKGKLMILQVRSALGSWKASWSSCWPCRAQLGAPKAILESLESSSKVQLEPKTLQEVLKTLKETPKRLQVRL